MKLLLLTTHSQVVIILNQFLFVYLIFLVVQLKESQQYLNIISSLVEYRYNAIIILPVVGLIAVVVDDDPFLLLLDEVVGLIDVDCLVHLLIFAIEDKRNHQNIEIYT